MSRCLSPADIRGCLTIAAIRPDTLRIIQRDYSDFIADKRNAGILSAVLRSLDLAIEQGEPSYFVADLTREAAHNWRPRQ